MLEKPEAKELRWYAGRVSIIISNGFLFIIIQDVAVFNAHFLLNSPFGHILNFREFTDLFSLFGQMWFVVAHTIPAGAEFKFDINCHSSS